MAKTTIPFGPQHPVLPEPLHLKLVCEDEVVVEAIPQLGFVHRGLESLAMVHDFNKMVYVVERICGICSCIHAVCYCNAVEDLLGIKAPPRAQYLRVIWSEMHRIHSHLLWLGLFADAFGFESVFMQFWKIREKIMDICEKTAGNRVILSVNIIGGVRRDINAEQAKWILSELVELEKEFKKLTHVMLEDYTVKARTVGVGVLTKEQVNQLGAAGPTLRGSGMVQDSRMLGYSAYNELNFTPLVETDGDCYARSKLRFMEVLNSINLIRQALAKIPESELSTKVTGNPEGESVFRVEQPRGELFYYVKGNGSKILDRVRVRTPTFANVPPLLAMLPGAQLAAVPLIVLTIDPCISCTER